MADDLWKEYSNNPVPGVVMATPKNDDPWADYTKESSDSKSRNKVSELPLSKKFNAALDTIGLGKILPRLPEDTDINKNQVGMSTSVMKGVPFVQHLIPDNPYQNEWAKENPIQDFTGKAFGFAGSAGAGANAVAAKVGQRFIPQLFSQMGFGGAVGGANEAVRQQVKGEEFDPYKIALTGGVDAGIASTGPIFGKIFSPGAKTVDKFANFEKEIAHSGWSPIPIKNIQDIKALAANPAIPELQAMAQQFLEKNYAGLGKAAVHVTDKASEAIKNALLFSAVTGAAGGHHPFGYLGGAAVGAASPFIKDIKDSIVKSAPVWWHNEYATKNPTARAILNSLLPSMKHGLEDNAT